MAKNGTLITVAVAVAGVSTASAFSPKDGLEIAQWLNAALGPVGFVAILTLGAGIVVSVFSNWFMWQRLIEREKECQAEKKEMQQIHAERSEQLRMDNKEAFGMVAELTKQVTILAERAGARSMNTPTRSS